jgi:hypothetical protein
LAISGVVERSGDFDGDGYDDIATVRDDGAVVVGRSQVRQGQQSFGALTVWATGNYSGNVPLVGDFNGDGRSDVAMIDSDGTGRVLLSTGTGFTYVPSWSPSLPAGSLISPADTDVTFGVGDFNGDNRTDLIVFPTGGPFAGWARVALSTGTGFTTPSAWGFGLATGSQEPVVGDFNGDGRDDVVVFTKSNTGDALVALNGGGQFGTPTKWHDWFSIDREQPAVGDFNGDGRDDIATYTRGRYSVSQVWVSLSTGTSFGASSVWQYFANGQNALPGIGDFNGDGRDDAVSWAAPRGNPPTLAVWVSLTQIYSAPDAVWYYKFGPATQWQTTPHGFYTGVANWP